MPFAMMEDLKAFRMGPFEQLRIQSCSTRRKDYSRSPLWGGPTHYLLSFMVFKYLCNIDNPEVPVILNWEL